VVSQGPPPAEVLVVSDHNPALAGRVVDEWPDVRVLESGGPPGLSGARNTGVAQAAGAIVAFLDDDARAQPDWLAGLVAPFADDRVLGTGGRAEAGWDHGRPRWFPPEFDWVVGCSYRGQPDTAQVVRNPLGCSMAFRRELVLEAGGFATGIGRVGRFPVGGEETELCIRIGRRHPDGVMVLAPASRVRHRVRPERGTWRYFVARCYQEGRSKARISALAGADRALASERAYVRRTLPRGVLLGLRDALRGDLAGLGRAMAIVLGLAVTTIGYGAGRLGLDAIRSSDPGSDPNTARWAAP